MEIAKKQQDLAVKECKMPLTDALLKYNRTEVNNALQPFKNGSEYNYPALLKIQERLPQMAKRNFSETLAMVVIAISKAVEAMNLARPMNSDQIVELAETVLDSSTEDFLALEDVVLFLQGLVRGKYGPLYESMDIPKFMEKFEQYREARYQALQNIRHEQHSNYKAMGDSNRSFSDADQRELDHKANLDYIMNKFKGQ
jgi:hypothetical protein